MIFRTAGAWGAGKGSNLTPAEVDANFYDADTRLSALETAPPEAAGIANVEISGLNWMVTLTDSTVLDPVPIPVPVFRFRGEWAAFTLYSELDSFTVAGGGLWTTLVAHTSGAAFDPDATTGSPPETLYQQIFPAELTLGLDDLLDVTLTFPGSPGVPGDNDFIAYDPGLGKWTNRTPTEATALLDEMQGDTGSPGGGVKGLVPAPADGDAAAGKVLGASGEWVVASTVGNLGDLGDVDTTGAAEGDFLSYSGSPLEWLPVSPSAISGLPDATLPLDGDSYFEVSELLGSPGTYSSAKVRLADLAITLGSTALELGATVATVDDLTFNDGTLSGTTTLPGGGQVTSAGEIGLGAAPVSLLDIAGTYTTANSQIFRVGAILASSVTGTQNGYAVSPSFAPTGASLSTAQAASVTATLFGSTSPSFRGLAISLATDATFSGTIGTADIIRVASLTLSGGANNVLNQVNAISTSINNGASSGTKTIRQFLAAGITSSAAGATINARGVEITVPSGGATSGTNNNRGLYITGNGGTAAGGTVNNFAVLSDSAAYSRIEGGLGVGVPTRNATNATDPYFYIPTCAGTPTGVPRNAAVGATAMVFDDTAHKLWLYEQSTSTWKGVVVA